MKIAAAFVGGLLLGVFLGTLATKEEGSTSLPLALPSGISEGDWIITPEGGVREIGPYFPPIGWTH